MSFIFSWIFSSTAVFVLEMLLVLAGKLVGNFLNFSCNDDLNSSKIGAKLVFSIFTGFIISLY